MKQGASEAERLKFLRARMKEYGTKAVLVTSPANRRYFSGFTAMDAMIHESSGALLITRRGQWLLTDSRYTEMAEREAPLFKIIDYRRGLGAELAALPAVKQAAAICFEPDFMSVALHRRLTSALPGKKLRPLPFSLDEPRSVKSAREIRLIKKALAITEAAVSALFKKMAPGLTEGEAALFLETEFRRLGADGPSFETIVASGPNASLPHAVPGGKKMKKGELVVVDCGAKYRGYCADITRTKMLGEPRPWQRKIYRIVREAQLLAIKAIKPGATGAEIDKIARDHIKSQGYGDYFGHGLGHGVGLYIHEAPTLSPRSHRPLEAGEIVTVEPGIYLPGKGGVRLEQLVLVTDAGRRVLNKNKDFYDF